MSLRTIFNIVALSLLIFTANADDCDKTRDCESCVTKTSWFFDQPCEWCPQDNGCHTFGSFFTNPCSAAQTVRSTDKCGVTAVRYSPDLAWKSVMLSAVAYSNDSSRFLRIAFPQDATQFDHVFTATRGYLSGFTATWSSERLIVVAFRGTVNPEQLTREALSVVVDTRVNFLGGEVQDYFKQAFNNLWTTRGLGERVRQLAATYPDYKILVTGHSLGGAIASLASTYLGKNMVAPERVVMYTFGMPRVGDYDYAQVHDRVCRDSWRITQAGDPVPHLPTCTQGGCNLFFGPYHHGTEVYYSSRTAYQSRDRGFKVCNGVLKNEDWSCANSIGNWATCWNVLRIQSCIDDHKYYFGVLVGDWWKDTEQ